MSMDEFKLLVDSMCIYSDYFVSNQVYLYYNIAMMTQVDELESDRHMNMSFTEFVESIARVAETIDIPNFSKDV